MARWPLLSAVRQNIAKHKIRWFSGQGGSLLIALLIYGVQKIWPQYPALSILATYVIVGGVVALFEAIRTLNSIFANQETSIASLRSIIESKDAEREQAQNATREAWQRRLEQTERALRDEIADLRARQDAPDVELQFDWSKYVRGKREEQSPPPFKLKNHGKAAVEVQVGDIEGGLYRARFPLVPDLDADAEYELEPTVEPTAAASPIVSALTQQTRTIVSVLESADTYRRNEILQQPSEREQSPDELAELEAKLASPHDIDVRLTYWNRDHSRQWERIETLHYEPHEHRAYVTHGKPEII